MKRKLPTILILLVMVLLGAMYWVDLSYYTDSTTGFITRGSIWVRYAVLVLPVFMALLGLRTVGPRAIAVLRVRNRPLAGLYVAAAVVGFAFGVMLIIYGFEPLSPYRIVLGLFFLWYGVWMFFAALQLLVQSAPSPTRGALPGIIAALPYCALVIYRVMIRPSSLYRMGPLVAALSALFAMLWMAMMLRALYIALPQNRVRAMYLLGVLTFLFSTCLELPQAIHSALFRVADPLALLESLNMGMLGLVAGCVSVAIAGQSEEPLPTKPREVFTDGEA